MSVLVVADAGGQARRHVGPPHAQPVSAQPDWYEPYAISLGIRVGNLVFVSGQAAVDEHGRTGRRRLRRGGPSGLRQPGHHAGQTQAPD